MRDYVWEYNGIEKIGLSIVPALKGYVRVYFKVINRTVMNNLVNALY
jgi:hypothetical protein